MIYHNVNLDGNGTWCNCGWSYNGVRARAKAFAHLHDSIVTDNEPLFNCTCPTDDNDAPGRIGTPDRNCKVHRGW